MSARPIDTDAMDHRARVDTHKESGRTIDTDPMESRGVPPYC